MYLIAYRVRIHPPSPTLPLSHSLNPNSYSTRTMSCQHYWLLHNPPPDYRKYEQGGRTRRLFRLAVIYRLTDQHGPVRGKNHWFIHGGKTTATNSLIKKNNYLNSAYLLSIRAFVV